MCKTSVACGLNRPVALNMILTGQTASEADVHRFQSQAAAANLDRAHIASIHEVGEYQGPGDDDGAGGALTALHVESAPSRPCPKLTLTA